MVLWTPVCGHKGAHNLVETQQEGAYKSLHQDVGHTMLTWSID